MFRHVLLGALTATAASALTVALAGPAAADTGPTCTAGDLVCAGPVADLHDVSNVLNNLPLLGRGGGLPGLGG